MDWNRHPRHADLRCRIVQICREGTQVLFEGLNTNFLTSLGRCGRCETHKLETVRTNVVGVLTLCDLCEERGIHMTNFATGCIFEYDATHPLGSGKGFKEEDKPNFVGSFYSFTKALVESLMVNYEHVLTLRVCAFIRRPGWIQECRTNGLSVQDLTCVDCGCVVLCVWENCTAMVSHCTGI